MVPSLDQRDFLGPALESVFGQTGNFSLICHVVDGGSTDGSVALLRSQTDARLIWTSAPDAGQADAVNRGIARGTGELIILGRRRRKFIGRLRTKIVHLLRRHAEDRSHGPLTFGHRLLHESAAQPHGLHRLSK